MADLPKQWALTLVRCWWDAILCAKSFTRLHQDGLWRGSVMGKPILQMSIVKVGEVTEKVAELGSG